MEVSGWFTRPENLEGILLNVVASFLWALIGGGFALLFNTYRNDRSKFAGKWKATVHWNPQWARKLFEVADEAPAVANPKSVGELSLSYGSGHEKSQYWGLAFFRLQNGDIEYGKIAVEVFDVVTSKPLFQAEKPYIRALKLDRFYIDALVRRPMQDGFRYDTQVSYYMEIEKSSVDRIEGTMMRRDPEQDEAVGRFVANRIL